MESAKLDLITVNNFLVKLRSPIARSRVQIINRLTRQIHHFKSKKGTKEQVMKNQRKAERLRKEIQIMAKLSKNLVARFAVLNKQKCLEDTINPEVMNQDEINSKLEKRAMLRISNHSLIEKQLDTFRAQFPTWEEELKRIMPILGEKSRTKKEQKLQKKVARKKPKSSNPKPVKEKEDFNFNETQNIDGSDDEKVFVSSLKSLIQKPSRKAADISKNPTNPEDIVSLEKNASKKLRHKGENLRRKNNELVIKPFSLNGDDSNDSDSSVESNSDNETLQNPTQGSKIKDSFFLGGGSDSDSEGSSDHQKSVNSSNPRGSVGRGRQSDQHNSSWGRGMSHRPTDNRPLHPSWSAKKNLATSISAFSGKRTKFDEVGEAVQNDRIISQKPQETSKVHPSWAAKQNQKKTIVPFQGRKTNFDEHQDQTQSKETLHPSWAAKQTQKIGIQNFQGKKIVFTD